MKRTNNTPYFSPLLWFSLCVLLLAGGCSARPAALTVSYQPTGDIDLAGWAEGYPQAYAEWEGSVHGEAYLSGDDNAATCNDCHADPLSEEIKAGSFRLEVPARCARCHDDGELMAQYEIADDTVETYLADFHGTTIGYYQAVDPEALRDEAVCSDCHGSHAVYPPEDDHSTVSADNLQATCQQCHSGAEVAFTSAYGHYRPIQSPASSDADATIVFIVKLAYQALIPVTLGGMLGYIALDVRHRVKNGNTKADQADREEQS